ncbi:MAG: M56 family metallopeptidase [Pseudohongiella sp.]|uniref:TonB family protein n=1 Tax=Pseudohongiella sp. TaxID=1979412 RepID=UPI0034A082F6
MNSLSWMTDTVQLLATALYQFPLLQLAIDLALKSVVVLLAFLLLDLALGRKLSSSSRHLLWLSSLFCLAILPWLPALISLLPEIAARGQGGANTLIELTVVNRAPEPTTGVSAGALLLMLYLLPAALMLTRLIYALIGSQRIFKHARPVDEASTMMLLGTLKQTLSISRDVKLRLSNVIESPVSFGLIRPTILLPTQSADWNTSIMTDVLLHELGHIKRLDWLTTLFAYGLACLYWMNPLVWRAVRHLREESENSCDAAVLNAGRSDTDYAESLLGVATHCLHARRTQRSSYPLMQTMLDQNTLTNRISRVLEENKMQASDVKKEIRKTAVLLTLVSAGMLSVLGATQVLSAQEQRPAPATRAVNEEMLPLHNEQPVYPRVAAEGGVEGWVHVRFTVNAAGTIDEDSIAVVDAEPADIFNNSAMAATRKFRFSPRMRDGEPVAVPNVQYVFRYKLAWDPEN